MTKAVHKHLRNWIPYKISPYEGNLLFHWLYTAEVAYTHPFFNETLGACKKHMQNARQYKPACNAAMLEDWSTQQESIAPAAFIFHVSRCGSTLVAQALGMKPEHITLAEVPVFDDILRLKFQHPQYNDAMTGNLLKAAIRFYGAKRTGLEEKLFIKTDSWHLLFHRQLRQLYPHTPFIILYRNPAAVLHSNHHKKGLQAVYGLIEPELFGLENITDEQQHPDAYMPLVLEKYYKGIINICRTDRQTLLLNYDQGLEGMMQEIAAFTGTHISDAYAGEILERGGYNAKHPNEKFAERTPGTSINETVLHKLNLLYEEIEKQRQGVVVA